MTHEKVNKRFKPRVFYPGGSRKMSHFIDKHLKYPSEAIDQKIQGTVRLRLDISYLGKVIRTKVISSLGYGCDKEAQRVVSLLNFEIKNLKRKSKVLFHKTLNVRFRLPKEKEPSSETVLNYRVVKNEKEKAIKPKSKDSGYSYQIEF